MLRHSGRVTPSAASEVGYAKRTANPYVLLERKNMLDAVSQVAATATNELPYDPGLLLDTLCVLLMLKTDKELAKALEIGPSMLSKIRCRRIPVGATVLIRMHEVSGLTIAELRKLMGDRRKKFRLSDDQGRLND